MQAVARKKTMFTTADADRLPLLHRFVTRPLEARFLKGLEERIESAEIVEPEHIPADVVTMNSRVLVRNTDSGEEIEYTVVFPVCADARRRRISVLGSLGSALVGARVGETLDYETSAGPRRVTVEAIVYQPEAAGDLYG